MNGFPTGSSAGQERGAAASGIGLAAAATVVLLAWGAAAQAPQPLQPPATIPAPAQGQAAGQAAPASPQAPAQAVPNQAVPNQAAPNQAAPAAPGYQPGFIGAVGRWMQESTAGFNAAWDAMPGKGMGDAAANAAKSTADAAKGAAEATQGAANAMGSAARDTAGALSRLPAARIVVGREPCAIAPNGAPDCRVAAAALCKAHGYSGGSSVDFETAENCPSAALMARWRGEEVTCATENYVTRSLCQ